jgi:molybdopterin/thiamine biosynthesis adenylyltransferase
MDMLDINVKIIGMGGIGTSLVNPLCRYIQYIRAQSKKITIIDGDEFEAKNLERQAFFETSNKASSKARELSVMFDEIIFEDIQEYVTKHNISSIINEGDLVFVCVDNHASRKLISDYANTLDNIIIVSGGNEYTDGNVQIFIRKGGSKITPSLTEHHREIATPGDKSPADMSCEELAHSEPQLLFTNLTVATIMCWVFYSIMTLRVEPKACSEIYFDIKTMTVRPTARLTIN